MSCLLVGQPEGGGLSGVFLLMEGFGGSTGGVCYIEGVQGRLTRVAPPPIAF